MRTKVHVTDLDGILRYTRLWDDGGQLLLFDSGFGFVDRDLQGVKILPGWPPAGRTGPVTNAYGIWSPRLKDVTVGSRWTSRISGKLVPVRVLEIVGSGLRLLNEKTGRAQAKLRRNTFLRGPQLPRLDRVAEVKRKIASEGPESYVALRLEGLEARLTDTLDEDEDQEQENA